MDINFRKIVEILSDKLNNWFTAMIQLLPNLIIAAIVFVVGFFLARRLRKFLEVKFSGIFPTSTIANLAFSILYVIMILMVAFTGLKIIGLDAAIEKTLAGAGIIGVGLAFAFQDIAANFMSGIFLAFRRPFYKGEIIRVKEFEGFVTEVKLRDTCVMTYQGQLITIPNRELFQNPIINYTRVGKRRADIIAGIPKNNDLEEAQKIATAALRNVDKIIMEDSQVIFREIKGNITYFVAECWVNSGVFNDYKLFINDCIIAIDKAFKKNNISMLNEELYLEFDNDQVQDISEN